MKVTKGEIKVGRFVVPYRVYGQSHKSIVCVSGAQQTMAVWKSFVTHFCRDFSIVVFDLPGQGRSKTLSGSPTVSLDEQVAALRHVIATTSQENGRVHISAASWGTIVVAAYAARYPSTVDRIILGGFGMKPSKAMSAVIRDGQRMYDENKGRAIGRLIVERFGQNIPEFYKNRIVNQFRTMKQDKYRAFYAHCNLVEDSADINRFVNLEKIQAETLIVNGEKDTILDQKDAEAASRRIPNCELRIIPNVGHFLHFERAEILGIYEAFLARA